MTSETSVSSLCLLYPQIGEWSSWAETTVTTVFGPRGSRTSCLGVNAWKKNSAVMAFCLHGEGSWASKNDGRCVLGQAPCYSGQDSERYSLFKQKAVGWKLFLRSGAISASDLSRSVILWMDDDGQPILHQLLTIGLPIKHFKQWNYNGILAIYQLVQDFSIVSLWCPLGEFWKDSIFHSWWVLVL